MYDFAKRTVNGINEVEATLQCVKEVGALRRKHGVWKEFSIGITFLHVLQTRY